MPEDFNDLSVEGLLKEFREKDYLCICLMDIPFIAIRSEKWDKIISPLTYLNGDCCMLLTPKGCSLTYEKRPTGGKMLIPSLDTDCKSELSEHQVNLAWLPYQQVLLQVVAALK